MGKHGFRPIQKYGNLEQALISQENKLTVYYTPEEQFPNDSAEVEFQKRMTTNVSQRKWVNCFNTWGERMISSPYLYRAVDNGKSLEKIHRGFKSGLVCTSTEIYFNGQDLNARIEHDPKSIVVNPIKLRGIVPICDGISLIDALKSQELISYLQALFCTSDDAEKIKETLRELFRTKPDDITILTPTQGSRMDHGIRAVWFGNNKEGKFCIDAENDAHPIGDGGYTTLTGISYGLK